MEYAQIGIFQKVLLQFLKQSMSDSFWCLVLFKLIFFQVFRPNFLYISCYRAWELVSALNILGGALGGLRLAKIARSL